MITTFRVYWRRLLSVLAVVIGVSVGLVLWTDWTWDGIIRLAVQLIVVGLILILLQDGVDDRRELRKMVILNERTLEAAISVLADRATKLEDQTAGIANVVAETTVATAKTVETHLTKIGESLDKKIEALTIRTKDLENGH